MNTPTLQDTRCVRCGSSSLEETEPAEVTHQRPSPEVQGDIRHGAIRCAKCSVRYDVIWGTPFIGAFEASDITGLIEIAANARSDNGYPDASTIRRLEDLLARYHAAPDRDQFTRTEADQFVREPWFQNRYSEWLQFHSAAEGIDLRGLRVLDVGAGTGFDCYRLVAAGARVTAIEYNPMLVSRGARVVPEARWIGALSHALPFVSGSFDVVCCNAALHHMRDVSASLEEMLRVLKPGGWLITTGDPFRASHSTAESELAVFNSHPDVLLGVNESIPPFASFESVLVRHRDKLEVRILTETFFPEDPRLVAFARRIGRGLRRRLGFTPAETSPAKAIRWWDFDRDRSTLARGSGSLALRCRLRESIGVTPQLQGETVLAAGRYAQSLIDYQEAVQMLGRLIPPEGVDRPFPGSVQSKLELLNGWQAPDSGDQRSAYRRARWFLRRLPANRELSFAVRRVTGAVSGPSTIAVLINGARSADAALAGDEWKAVSVSLAELPPGDVFVCEIQLEGPPARFDDGLFQVRDRSLN